MSDTRIEWSDKVWNPVTGCDRVSPGCAHCYALTMAARLKAMGQPHYQRDGDPRTSGPGFGVALHPDLLDAPLRWRKPRRVFVNSMSDLFHERVPDEFIAEVFAVMAATPRHTFQVLTKRPERMRERLSRSMFDGRVCGAAVGLGAEWPEWPLPNVWLGVSVENQRWADERIPLLLETPAAVRFLSCEPLLGPVDLGDYLSPVEWRESETCSNCHGEGEYVTCIDDLCYRQAECIHGDPPRPCRQCVDGEIHHPGRDEVVDWVIIGGESGPRARPMDVAWARSLVSQCRAAGAAAFVKQLGARPVGLPPVRVVRNGDHANRAIETWPEDLRVREYPT